ncbi:hypothetical protein Cni_G25343 [Canna indica]|uniref:Uncharacterized protein n=1 Tax=Canna indica TaxID=4628 RepID=A0AAQ3L1Q0_9LILI|nr:hypothetical protein Cni_G25343 [Canna indica]
MQSGSSGGSGSSSSIIVPSATRKTRPSTRLHHFPSRPLSYYFYPLPPRLRFSPSSRCTHAMAEHHEAPQPRLPSDFLCDFRPLAAGTQGGREVSNKAASFARARGLRFETAGEDETEEEDRLLAGLAQRIGRYFLFEDDDAAPSGRAKRMPRSPQSTLCSWSASNKGSPNGPSTPLSMEQRKYSERCDLLYEAADQVMRLRRLADPGRSQSLYDHGQRTITPARKPALAVHGAPKNVNAGYHGSVPVLPRQQLQAAQFYHPKLQPAAAWGRQSKARGYDGGYREGGYGHPLDLPPSAWPPPQHQQTPWPVAIFHNPPGARKESIGTGVFLPRVAKKNKHEPKKKTARSTELVPERAIQAFDLNLEEFAAQRRPPSDADVHIAGSSTALSHLKKSHHLRAQPTAVAAAAATAHEIGLPQEWTY